MNRGALRVALQPRAASLLTPSLSAFHRLHQTFSTLPTTPPTAPPTETHHALDFDDVSKSFASKTDGELLRAYLVYRICTIRPIVNHADKLLALSHRMLGRSLTSALIKPTFFKQFCAGEDAEEIKPLVDRLERAGLGSILDYAAEADVGASHGGTGHSAEAVKIQDPSVAWRENTQLFANSIVEAGRRSEGFAAIKITAIADPELLIKITNHIKGLRMDFILLSSLDAEAHFDPLEQSPQIPSDMTLTLDVFKSQMSRVKVNEKDSDEMFRKIDKNNTGTINYNQFLDYFSLFAPDIQQRLRSLPEIVQWKHQQPDSDIQALLELKSRCDLLAAIARDNKVRLLVDAEQSYFQYAIDLLVSSMQSIANRGEVPYVYNTYQCYLRDTYQRCVLDYQRSVSEGWKMAAKLVRGAYMRQERQRAKDRRYNSPVCASFDETSANYHKCVEFYLNKLASGGDSSLGLVIAGHNESSVRWSTQRMSELNLSRRQSNIHFGQLLGMCDHVSYALANQQYKVVKVCPYGPVTEVMPYLIRRAQENADVLERATKEMRLVRNELLRRKLPALRSQRASPVTKTAQ